MGRTRSILDHVQGAGEPGYGLLATKIPNYFGGAFAIIIIIFKYIVYAHVECQKNHVYTLYRN